MHLSQLLQERINQLPPEIIKNLRSLSSSPDGNPTNLSDLNNLQQCVSSVRILKEWDTKKSLFTSNRKFLHAYRFLVYYVLTQIVAVCQHFLQEYLELEKKLAVDQINIQYGELELSGYKTTDNSSVKTAKKLLGQLNRVVDSSISDGLNNTTFLKQRRSEVNLLVELCLDKNIDSSKISRVIDSYLNKINLGGVLVLKVANNRVSDNAPQLKQTCQLVDTDAIDVFQQCFKNPTGENSDTHYNKCLQKSHIHQMLLFSCLLYKGVHRRENPPMGTDLLRVLRANKKDAFIKKWGHQLHEYHLEWKDILEKLNTQKKLEKKQDQTLKRIKRDRKISDSSRKNLKLIESDSGNLKKSKKKIESTINRFTKRLIRFIEKMDAMKVGLE